MVPESLVNYIRMQISSGKRLDAITSILIQQGFSQQQIDEAYSQLGNFNAIQLTTPAAPIQRPRKKLLPFVITVLAILVLLILGMFLFSNKNKSTLISSLLTYIYSPTTSQISHVTQGLPDCTDPTRWTTSVGTSFNAATYLKPVSTNICEYTDPLLGYTIQYPANWYIYINPSPTVEESSKTSTINKITNNKGSGQRYNLISFVSQQISALNSSPQAVSISITSSKMNYSDIINYMASIQTSTANVNEVYVAQNLYKTVRIDGQKAIQYQYNLVNNVGIDTKFILNGILYDISFNGTSLNAINANKQYYRNLLNSFTLKST